MSIFGDWTDHIDEYRSAFCCSKPTRHVVIEDFFHREVAAAIKQTIPIEKFEHIYWNPIEKKSVISNLEKVPYIRDVFETIGTSIDLFEQISDIHGLEADAWGGGVHRFFRGGKLDLHLDYSQHPYTGQERRMNLIVFFSENWDSAWGGATELWNADCTKPCMTINPGFNKALLFETTNISWHGVPKPVCCPETVTRDSIACYFVSKPTENMDPLRQKALFVPHPEQQLPTRIQRLYSLRKERRLSEEDLWHDWEIDPIGKGFWW